MTMVWLFMDLYGVDVISTMWLRWYINLLNGFYFWPSYNLVVWLWHHADCLESFPGGLLGTTIDVTTNLIISGILTIVYLFTIAAAGLFKDEYVRSLFCINYAPGLDKVCYPDYFTMIGAAGGLGLKVTAVYLADALY